MTELPEHILWFEVTVIVGASLISILNEALVFVHEPEVVTILLYHLSTVSETVV